MGRIHAFELEDQPWFPRVLREAGMAFLRFGAERLGQAESIRPVIEDALDRSGQSDIVDLCSGGGGPAPAIARSMRRHGRTVTVTLTDLFPDANAVAAVADDHVTYEPTSVDATRVPAERKGLRTMFNAFHHFRPAQASAILGDAVRSRQPIAVVEVVQRRVPVVLGMLFAPLLTLLLVPFLRPFRWSWLPLTYVVPVIPLFIGWDGIISALRAYDRGEIAGLIRDADPDGAFEWRVTDVPIKGQPLPGLAVVGMPKPVG